LDKKTPLYDSHVALGGRMVPFAGHLLPVHYPGGVIAEHMAVRTACGLFDVSHMGDFLLEGSEALSNLQTLLTNDMSTLAPGFVRYSPMCNPQGGIVDDLIVYRLGEERYMLVVNAANREKDLAFIRGHLPGGGGVRDISDTLAQVALQGPRAREVLARLCREEDLPQTYYSFAQKVQVGNIACLTSRTGYTGEDGFELYCQPGDAPALWRLLLEAGQEAGLIPCGLGARDTLRLEAGMPLYGHEMDESITPLEAGLKAFVKMSKPDFLGKAALLAGGEAKRRRIGLRITGRGIARDEFSVFSAGRQVGHTTSGTFCPYLRQAMAMALVEAPGPGPGDEVEVEVRGRRIAAQVVPLPFYKRERTK
jgi:aminomethyltransferase